MWRIWIDTGGTFTDGVAVAADGEGRRAKILSTSALRGRVIRQPSADQIQIEGELGRARRTGARIPLSPSRSEGSRRDGGGLRPDVASHCRLQWLDGRTRPADELILQTIPIAAAGLASAGIAERDSNRLLDLITERVASGQTGSRWMMEGYNRLRAVVPQDEALQGITRAYVERQRTSRPVHTWEPAAAPDRDARRAAYERISQVMQREFRSVRAEDSISLAEAMMRWEDIRYVPVENEQGQLVGLVSLPDLFTALREGRADRNACVAEIMNKDVPTVDPEANTLDVLRRMRHERVACIPVVRDGKLVGLVSEVDFLTVAARLLE